MPRLLRAALFALGGAVVTLLVVLGLWAVDLHRHDGKVVRNVVIGDRAIGGLPRSALASEIGRFAGEFASAKVTVTAPGGGFDTDAQTIGLGVDGDRTLDAVLAVGRAGAPHARVWSWLRSFVDDREAPVKVTVDRDAVWRTVTASDPGAHEPPTEPRIEWQKDAFHVVAGKAGKGIDPEDVIRGLPGAVARGVPVVVRVDRGEVAPRWSKADAQRLVTTAERNTAKGLAVTAGGTAATIPAPTVRSWITSTATVDSLDLAFVEGKVVADLAKALPKAGEPPVESSFSVEGGRVQITGGKAGTACCAAAAEAKVAAALFEGASTPVDLPLRPQQPELTLEKARALQIAAPVGSFTTKHACCEPRVANIHRIADLVRGAVILPGKTFSVNGFVGRRTVEKGFVSAPIIAEGNTHGEDVGGGISQFATTFFNAAFFAGLDFGEYQAHTLYISRYPYGREATMGYPHPDLQIKNTTPYGVLIWPTYTDTSLTMTLYSTRYASGDQTGQTTAPAGNCTRVKTERTRTYADGHTSVDHVYATYAPGEGTSC
ncbi:MAG TPA: VanW family protein [Acidimicrobiales bacterium]|nr:VanW family protein [Acidimicrobiales bacterium]